MIQINYNPDVLSCLANLSNDEVFTPPKLANDILDLLPVKLWQNPDAKFLDPVSKSGVFLREIAKRLMVGLEPKIPDKQERINHILKNQLFGIAITELTALLSRRTVYCSKTANSQYSVCTLFDDEQGNILYKSIQHTWKNGKCTFCGANEDVYSRDKALETYAYNFIHTDKPQKLFNMKFDVIVGNPPYQLDTGGSGRQAKPIYQLFVNQAKKLNPKYLIMIMPARWYSGGMGLDDFRKEMLNDKRIKELVDFKSSKDVFPGVDIAGGICYFLWDKDYEGDCNCTTISKDKNVTLARPLNEFSIFIRESDSVSIIRKVLNKNSKFLNERVSPIKPFGMPTNYVPKDEGVPCWFIQKIGLKYASQDDVTDSGSLIDRWKVLIPKAPIAGQTDFSKPIRIYHDRNAFISKPGECCTESWIVANSFKTEDEALSFKTYLFTKTVRFLILQTVISQDINKKNFQFVPDLDKYEGTYTDEVLIKEWGITQQEWEFINSRIKAVNDIENESADE